MKNRLVASAAALACTMVGLTALPSSAEAAAASPPVVTISVVGDAAQVSTSVVRPGIVEFTVGDTFTIPGPQGGPDMLTVLKTDQLDLFLATIPAVFGDPSDPAAAAAAAAGMRTIHGIATAYGGGNKGTTWRVYLNEGTYNILGVQSTAMGLAKPAVLTVAGTPRAGVLPFTQASVRAVGPVGNNKWTFRQSKAPVEWLRFTNSAHEIHFMNMTGVKLTTTDAMVKKSFSSNSDPKWVTGPNYSFDVISPGVSVAIKGPFKAGRYLVDCFIPSETDGMPHALMGMWKLFNVE